MRAVLTICRERGQPPSWWERQSRGDRALMLAEYRTQAKEAAAAHKRAQGRAGGRRRG